MGNSSAIFASNIKADGNEEQVMETLNDDITSDFEENNINDLDEDTPPTDGDNSDTEDIDNEFDDTNDIDNSNDNDAEYEIYENDENVSVMDSRRIDDEEILSEEEYEEIQSKFDSTIQKLREKKANGYVGVEYVDIEDNDVSTYAYYDEREPNNTRKTANRVFYDETVYGAISDEDDIDYFKIKFPESGYNTFILKDVPEDCDYDLYLFGSGGDDIDSSLRGTGKNEYIYSFVTKDVYYYVLVDGLGNYSRNEYTLSFRFEENETEFAFSVGTDYNIPGKTEEDPDGEIDTSQEATYAADCFADMGYTSVLSIYPTHTLLDEKNANRTDRLGSSIVYLNGHGNSTRMHFYYAYNMNNNGYNKYNTGVSTDYTMINGNEIEGLYVPLSDKYIEDSRLMIFMGCDTATPDSNKMCLPKFAVRESGVETAIGWRDKINNLETSKWSKNFLRKLKIGYSVVDAADYADENIESDQRLSDWRIYGNHDNVVNLYGPYSIQKDDEELVNLLTDENKIIVYPENEDLSALEQFIESVDNNFNKDDYVKKLREVADNVYKVTYIKYLNGFSTRMGYSALIKDGEVTRVSPRGNVESLIMSISDEVFVTPEMEKEAKMLGRQQVPEEYQITEQIVERMIIDSQCCLVVYTNYAIGYDTPGVVYGSEEYIYKIEQ